MFELLLARRNAEFIRRQGGYEVGGEHYPYLVLLHGLFFFYLYAEVYRRGLFFTPPVPLFLAVFLAAQFVRIWCLVSLGKFWNTRIFILPGSSPIIKGPYRYIRHPNYVVVAVEMLTLPLSFGAVYTALLFSIINAVVLKVRIRSEEKALKEIPAYREYQERYGRFIP